MEKDNSEVLASIDAPYLVVKHRGIDAFQVLCCLKIEFGYLPQGGVQIVFNDDATIYAYCQAFVKLKK